MEAGVAGKEDRVAAVNRFGGRRKASSRIVEQKNACQQMQD
jgi:hypothetical protein